MSWIDLHPLIGAEVDGMECVAARTARRGSSRPRPGAAELADEGWQRCVGERVAVVGEEHLVAFEMRPHAA